MKIIKQMRLTAALLAVLMVAVLAAGCGGAKKEAEAPKYPTKQVNMIIAFTAGGSSDVQARIVEKYWKKNFNEQPLVFDYKTGAGGQVGFTEIVRAKNDGYTIGGINVPHIAIQSLSPQATFKIEDFAYIAQVVVDPTLLAVKADSPIKDIKGFIDEAKKKNGKMTVGIVGTFTAHHLALLQLQEVLGITVTPVPFTGAADQNVALMGGHIDAMIGNLNDVMRDLSKFKLLAIATENRHEWVKDVPTFKEQGYNFLSDIRRGFAAPKGIDQATLTRLRDGFKAICNDPAYIEDMKKIGQPHAYLNGDEFEKVTKQYFDTSKTLVEKYGLNKKQ